MTNDTASIQDRILRYVTDHFLGGDTRAGLRPETALVSGGIVDSLGVLDLVAYLESTYDILLEAHEVSRDRFDTVADIAAVVARKVSPGR